MQYQLLICLQVANYFLFYFIFSLGLKMRRDQPQGRIRLECHLEELNKTCYAPDYFSLINKNVVSCSKGYTNKI